MTAAWDAAYEGVKLAAPEDAPKAVLLTSDGEDDASHEITASKLIKAAVDAGVAIFTLGMSDDENSDGMKYLFKISSETGGLFYYFQDTSQMESVYDAIAQAFNQALVATWTSTYSSGAVYVKVEVQTASDKASTISAYHF